MIQRLSRVTAQDTEGAETLNIFFIKRLFSLLVPIESPGREACFGCDQCGTFSMKLCRAEKASGCQSVFGKHKSGHCQMEL